MSETGVAGLALSGGVSSHRRLHGMTIDNLVSAEVVTADGRRLRAAADEHPDLYWALRGGGGNYGVVTSFEFRLHPVGPEVYNVAVYYPVEHSAAMFKRWRDAVADAPDELTQRGVRVDAARRARAARGAARAAGVRHLRHVHRAGGGGRARQPRAARARAAAARHERADAVRRRPVVAGPVLPRGAALLLEGALPGRVLRRRGGRHGRLVDAPPVARLARDHPPPRRRDRPRRCRRDRVRRPRRRVHAEHRRDLARRGRRRPQHRLDARLLAGDAPLSAGKTYFNFPGLLEEGDAAIRDSYGANHARLAAIKAAYDPENVFRGNQNIKPAS